jgi:hypothetical protein
MSYERECVKRLGEKEERKREEEEIPWLSPFRHFCSLTGKTLWEMKRRFAHRLGSWNVRNPSRTCVEVVRTREREIARRE